jgi:hypothetical protein
MAFNINNFISTMARDGVRPNLFEIIFMEVGATFTFRATATQLPASTIGVARTNYFGREAKFAGNRVFGDWTVNVLMDETDFQDIGPRGRLEQWSNLMNTHIANVRNPAKTAPSSYMRDAMINLWSKDGAYVTASYKMTGCFPVNIGEVGLDWGANDQIASFPVTFAMQWWERNDAFGTNITDHR